MPRLQGTWWAWSKEVGASIGKQSPMTWTKLEKQGLAHVQWKNLHNLKSLFLSYDPELWSFWVEHPDTVFQVSWKKIVYNIGYRRNSKI